MFSQQSQLERPWLDGDEFIGDEMATGLTQQFPNAAVVAEKQPLPLAAGADVLAEQWRGQYARVVQHQQIARCQQVRKLAEDAMS